MAFYPWWLLARRLFPVLAAYFFLRLFFLAHNWASFQDESARQIFDALIHGFRFDLWTIGWVFLPFFVAGFFPWRWQRTPGVQKSLFAYFMFCNFVFITMNVVDSEWFKFTGRRMTLAWFHLQKDVQGQTWTFMVYYWWLAILIPIILGILYWSYPKARYQEIPAAKWWQKLLVNTCVAVALFTAMRGGYQFKPLGLNDAYATASADIGALTMNSTFSLIKNRKIIDTLNIRFFKEDREAYQTILNRDLQRSKFFGQLAGYNVVLIIVESLPSEYVGTLNPGRPTYTPFLDELSQKSILFKSNFANGRRSVEAVPSVMCSFPSMMSEALVLSPYQGIRMHCLGHALSDAGYKTLFFHGAYNGSMHVDAMALRSGFEKFYGYDEFPDKSFDDGSWGIFDEPMFHFAIEEINRQTKPFAAAVFTLTSHNPYRVPDHLKGKFPKGTLEAHEVIGYADYSIKQFFNEAEKQDWFKKTIFIITGDHTHKTEDPNYSDMLGYYRVPLWVYIPGRPDLKADSEKITQHIDIYPTIMDLLGLDLDVLTPFGQSLFNESPGLAYTGMGSAYFLVNPDWLVTYNIASQSFNFSRRLQRYELKPVDESGPLDPALENSRAQALAELKARLHYFNWAVSNNKLIGTESPQ